jgi:hypothetical protein
VLSLTSIQQHTHECLNSAPEHTKAAGCCEQGRLDRVTDFSRPVIRSFGEIVNTSHRVARFLRQRFHLEVELLDRPDDTLELGQQPVQHADYYDRPHDNRQGRHIQGYLQS